jgi:hypothetical protein
VLKDKEKQKSLQIGKERHFVFRRAKADSLVKMIINQKTTTVMTAHKEIHSHLTWKS